MTQETESDYDYFLKVFRWFTEDMTNERAHEVMTEALETVREDITRLEEKGKAAEQVRMEFYQKIFHEAEERVRDDS